MIEQARARAARAINLELVGLYWNLGAYVSERTRTEGWGNAVIARFSDGSNSSATASSPTGGKSLNPSTGPTGLLRGLRVSRPRWLGALTDSFGKEGMCRLVAERRSPGRIMVQDQRGDIRGLLRLA
ncbi:MAG: DUF1016 N-terminal domain-containing protein [Actinobacteria bacterium]|nr:DUF1016 N-terminal domain-containing protein [Actinomycetota bacterium]